MSEVTVIGIDLAKRVFHLVVLQAVERFDIPNNGWLKRFLTRKPRTVAAIALANKMAPALWAMMKKQEEYRNPVAAIA